jgi:hypothetical protein
MELRLTTSIALAAALAVWVLAAPAQAQTPGGPTGPYGPYVPYTPAADKQAPRLTKVALKPKSASGKVRRTLTFTLDESARVSGVVMRRAPGVRTRGRRCVRRTRARKGRGCVLRTRAGTLLAARAGRGANRARLSVRELPPGEYTLSLTPTDAAGNVGATKSASFTVRRERRARRKTERRAKRKTEQRAKRKAERGRSTSAPS